MNVYRIELDPTLCVGYGSCAELAPDAFQLDGDAATVRRGTSSDPKVVEAADLCPMSAITVTLAEAA
jgi:ferredoxin